MKIYWISIHPKVIDILNSSEFFENYNFRFLTGLKILSYCIKLICFLQYSTNITAIVDEDFWQNSRWRISPYWIRHHFGSEKRILRQGYSHLLYWTRWHAVNMLLHLQIFIREFQLYSLVPLLFLKYLLFSTMKRWIVLYLYWNLFIQLCCICFDLASNGCSLNYGGCSNLCARDGRTCCNCAMDSLGPSMTCTCCPAVGTSLVWIHEWKDTFIKLKNNINMIINNVIINIIHIM